MQTVRLASEHPSRAWSDASAAVELIWDPRRARRDRPDARSPRAEGRPPPPPSDGGPPDRRRRPFRRPNLDRHRPPL